MFIRLAKPNEMKIIHSYAKKVQDEATMGYLNQDKNVTDTFPGKNRYFVLIDQGALCGWICVGEMMHPYVYEKTGMILELYVIPAYRHNGFGLELMKYALAFFNKKGFKNVQLNVFAGNPAIEMYKKLGFTDVSSLMEKKLK